MIPFTEWAGGRATTLHRQKRAAQQRAFALLSGRRGDIASGKGR